MSADDEKNSKAEAEAPDLRDTLPLTETLKIVDAPAVAEVPEFAAAPYRRRKKGRLREQAVRVPVSEPPKQFIAATKPPKWGVTLRQVTQLTFAVALIGYLLLAYLRMRTVTQVQKAVRKTAVKTTDSL